MITDGEKSHYLALKNILTAGGYRGPVISLLSRLLNGITSKHQDDFYCLNCLRSFATENKLKFHEKICKKKHFYGTFLSTRKDNTRI